MQSLIRREGYLIVVDDGGQAAEGEGEGEGEGAGQPSISRNIRNSRILAVAPNYVVD